MINSVVKPSTQGQAALNNFEDWSATMIFNFDTHAFGNNNTLFEANWFLELGKGHNYTRVLLCSMAYHGNKNRRCF